MTAGISFDESVLTPDPARRQIVVEIMSAALAAVNPYDAVRRAIQVEGSWLRTAGSEHSLDQIARILVVGAGKAGAPMAQAIESRLGAHIENGLVVVKDDHLAPTSRIELVESSHPVPDSRGVQAGNRILAMAERATASDLVITLLSGGGSALLVAPAQGISLVDMQQMTQSLLEAGATINEINCLRKHCSALKGGQLARAIQPAASLTLAVSDVIGSPLDVIASGPTVPDLSTWEEAWEIVTRFRLESKLPLAITQRLEAGIKGVIPDTPKPADPAFVSAHAMVIADNRTAAEAAAGKAQEAGFNTRIMTTYLEGEAREVAKVITGFGREVLAHGNPVSPPACLIFGGETTVSLGTDYGLGGRNQELALAAGFHLQDLPQILVAALATDGTDGPTDSAGALADSRTISRSLALDLSPRHHLDAHDAYPVLKGTSDMLLTGPTFTNVNDLAFVFIFG